MTSMRCAAVLLCCAGAIAAARAHAEPEAAQTLKPADFAYRRAIALPQDQQQQMPVVSVELPADVYRASRSKGLADVLVFNAAGARVPAALQRPAAELESSQSATAVAFFPIALEQASSPIELALRITRGADGEVLALRSPSTPEPQSNQSTQNAQGARPVGAYVLDLRKLAEGTLEAKPPQLKAARFEWLQPPRDLILPLIVESSDDLLHWQTLAVDGGILHLEHDGQRIDRDRIEWSPLAAAFMRVRAVGPRGLPAQLQAVYIEVAAERLAPKLERVVAAGSRAADASPTTQQIFRFDLGGPVPVEEVELELPEDNSLIAAQLWAASASTGPYTQLAQATFYRVSAQDKSLQGPRLKVAPQNARFYELRVDPTRGALDSGAPKLVTLHVPERLLFVRRGEPPFTLAYGRHDAQLQRFTPDELLRLLPKPDTTAAPILPALASLDEPTLSGGLSLLDPPPAPPPYKAYALWATLIAGVALLAWLSLRLLRGNA